MSLRPQIVFGLEAADKVATMEAEARTPAVCMKAQDFLEAFDAFAERRRPSSEGN